MASIGISSIETRTPPQDFRSLSEQYKDRGVPLSLLKTLEKVLPLQTGVTLVVRHAERPEIPKEGEDNVLLSDEGKEASRLLGKLLQEKKPNQLITSPMQRCHETITEICQGASWSLDTIEKDPLLSPSGPFINDLNLAIEEYKRIGGPALFNSQIMQNTPPPGMKPTSEGINDLLKQIFHGEMPPGSINVFVTHDAVTTVLLGYLFKQEFNESNWPNFLDGALFWYDGSSYNVAWREEIISIPMIF